MSDKAQKEAAAAAAAAAASAYDPATLLALYSSYGMTAAGQYNADGTPKMAGTSSPYGAAAANPAAAAAGGLGLNQWWAMASQLAAQEYLTRIQAAARDPQAYAALAAQGVLPNYEMLMGGASKGRKTTDSPTASTGGQSSSEVKFTSSTTGSKEPGTSNRGRKKTISLDPNLSASEYANLAANISSSSNDTTPPIPSGLTIERKKAGQRSSKDRSSPAIDRVEITKIPISSNTTSSPLATGTTASSSSFKSSTPKAGSGIVGEGGVESPLNLSTKTPFMSPLMESYAASKSLSGSKIPQEYYASQALSGVFLAEQIRQQQLAAALESRLDSQSFSAMQAALLMNKLKAAGAAGMAGVDTSSLASGVMSMSSSEKKKASKASSSSHLAMGDKLNKNTVASLLAKSRQQQLTSDELEQAERAWNRPELTIEPLFRGMRPEQSDENKNGRQSDDIDESKIKIKTVSDSPEIRNLDEGGAGGGGGSASESDDGGRSFGKYATIETDELRLPLKSGWKREITVREYSKSGIRGDVLYYAPCGKKFKQYPDILRYLEKKGIKDLQREHFSFSTKVFIGDFLKPTGQRCNENGDEKYVRLSEKEMFEDIDKLRRENGWKPRRRGSKTASGGGGGGSGGTTTAGGAAVSSGTTTAGSGNNSKNSGGNSSHSILSGLEGLHSSQQKSLAETLLQKLQTEMQLRPDQQESFRLQQEALRILVEAERMESSRKDSSRLQQSQEAKKRRHEELQRQKQEEQLRKIQEREQKRQQAALIKEQAKQYEKMLFHQTMERERRKQHMNMMKQLEAKKRCDERERKREDLRIKTEREREKRMEQKRLEMEVITEMRKPIEDMSLDDHKELPKLERISGLRLSGEAFANVLMIYEFLHNFGETLGFDMDSLPTMDSLQAAFLYDQEAEEELLSVVIHLIVCAIEDPGIPHFPKHLTLLGQNLKQADITNTNVSEILKIYLTARGQNEVKLLHNLNPPEMLHAKDPRREHMCTPKKIEEYNNLLKKTKGYLYASWIKDKPFLCLNPKEKSEIVGFICNELLSNKALVHQIDMNVENISKAKKEKWEIEAQLKRLKIIQAKKLRQQQQIVAVTPEVEQQGESATDPAVVEDKDDTLSVASENENPKNNNKKKSAKNNKKVSNSSRKKQQPDPPEDEIDESNMSHNDTNNEAQIAKEMAEDEKMSLEELQKKIDKTLKKLTKKRDELAFISNRVRVHDLGQDRYRRRYHHFAFAGGVYVEAVESCEPWKLATQGMPHFLEDGRETVGFKGQQNKNNGVGVEVEDQAVVGKKEEEEPMEVVVNDNDHMHVDDEPPQLPIKINGNKVEDHHNDKENIVKKEETIKNETNENEKDAIDALSKLGKEILITPKLESKFDVKFMPKVTPNGEKLNLFNHTSNLNMTLNPVILNGAVTITPKDPSLVNNNGSISNGTMGEKPWFSILPLGNPVDHQAKLMDAKNENMFNVDNITPQINALEAKLDELRNMNLDKYRHPIPKEMCHGWWRLSKVEDVNQLEASLNSRGIREQHLITIVKRNLDLLQDQATKSLPDDLVMEPPEEFENNFEWEPDTNNAPPTDKPGDWSKQVALRVDKYILEQVEALEDKVASASMQVPGWKVPNNGDIDSRTFRPGCLYIAGEDNDEVVIDRNDEFGPEATNPVEEARERLMDLELNIERRYLKAPLGFSNTVSLQTITAKINNSIGDADMEDSRGADEEMEQDGDESTTPDESMDKEKALPKGLVTWREGVKNAKTAAQLAMAFYILETSICWQKSIMKAYCQLCHCGDNEDSLLLCDGCDKGYHTYCFKPELKDIPDGDWFCYECINKATGLKHCLVCGKQEGKNLILCSSCPRAYHTTCLSPALSKMPRGKWQCTGCTQKVPKKSKAKKRGPPTHLLHNADSDESPEQTNPNSPSGSSASPKAATEKANEKASSEPPPSPEQTAAAPTPPPPTAVVEKASAAANNNHNKPPVANKKRKLTKLDKDLTICHTLISEMEALEHAWPFLYPVNTKQFPTYKKVIKQPMDLATMKKKLDANGYKLRDEFVEDIRLIFSNCELFNEDDSPVGKAGHAMRSHFEARWAELTSN